MAPNEFTPDVKTISKLAEEVSSSVQSYERAKSSAEKAQALQSISQASQRLTHTATDPEDAFSDFTFQPLANASVRVALSMGLFEHLSESKVSSVEELAKLTNAEVALTAKIVRVLVAFDFLTEIEGEKYLPTPLGLVYADASRRAWATWMWDVMIRASGSLGPFFESHPLKTPTDQTKAPFAWSHNSTDADVFEIVQRIGKSSLLNDAMSGSSQLCAEEAVAIYKFDELVASDNEVVLVDVGGSKGQTLQEIRRGCPDLKGKFVLQDLQSVIDDGVLDGLDAEIQAYDFFQEVEPVKGAAAYLYQRIFHDWNDEKSRLILQNLKPAMSRRSKLLICDVVVQDTRPHPRKVLRDMNMFLVGGMERSEAQWNSLLESEGFTVEKIHGLQNPNNSIIEARLK